MMANIKCSLGSFVIFSWVPDQYCKKTLHFCDFSGGGSGPPAPSGSTHEGAILVFEPDPDGSRLSCILLHLIAFWRKDCNSSIGIVENFVLCFETDIVQVASDCKVS